jgi:hypothetical protein
MTEEEICLRAAQLGLRLQRSLITDPAVPGYGTYWLHDAETGLLVWPDRWGSELDRLAEWLEFAPKRTL